MGEAVRSVGAHSPDLPLNRLLSQLFERSDWVGDPIELSWADDRGSDEEATHRATADRGGSGSRLVDWGIGRFGQQPTALHEALVLIVQRQIRLALEDDPQRLHLHGALVGAVAPEGSRVLMVGASGAGKSTMAAQLVHLGLAYATDEMVALDADCCVEAVRKPLKLRQGAKSQYRYLESLVHPQLQGVAGDVPITPSEGQWLDESATRLGDIVVLSRHDAGPSCLEPCPALQRVSTVTMTRRMAENAFDFSRFGVGQSLLNLAKLAASARCWELNYCDSQIAAPILAELTTPNAELDLGAANRPPLSDPRQNRPVTDAEITLVGDLSVGAADDSLVGLRVHDAGLVCRPALPEHILVELSPEAFDIWELSHQGVQPGEIASGLGQPLETVLGFLATLQQSELIKADAFRVALYNPASRA